MTSSPASPSNPSPNPSTRRRKLRKIQNESATDNHSIIQWKSQSQQNLYSTKLLQALRHVQLSTGTAESSRVRQAADRVLAVTAKGRSRWSRAVLTGGCSSRLKLKFVKRKKSLAKRQRGMVMKMSSSSTRVVVTGNNRSQRKSKLGVVRLKSDGLPAVKRMARVLGRLVPGCRKQPLPVVLQEASDYIPALEMQVRVMSALAELLSASGSSLSSGSTLARHNHWPGQLNSSQDLP